LPHQIFTVPSCETSSQAFGEKELEESDEGEPEVV
jgi:hypothetical protein